MYIHSSNIFDSQYIWIFKAPQKWLKSSNTGPKWIIWVKNKTKYENGQISPNNFGQIFWYLNILDEYIHSQKYLLIYFLGQIYLNIHLWSFYQAEYTRLFICPISMVTNVFGYSFVKKNIYWSNTAQDLQNNLCWYLVYWFCRTFLIYFFLFKLL